MANQKHTSVIRSVDTASGRIGYAEEGSGPVALFVPGAVLNKHVWRHQLAGLSDIRRCIAVDLLAPATPTSNLAKTYQSLPMPT